MSINVRLENTVRAFLSGNLKPVKEPTKEPYLINVQGIHEHTPVHVADFNEVTGEYHLRSEVVTYCALQGTKARDILNCLLSMELEIEGYDEPIAAVQLSANTGKGIMTSAVCSLGAVYEAVNYVQTAKIIKAYRVLTTAKKNPQTKSRKRINKPVKQQTH